MGAELWSSGKCDRDAAGGAGAEAQRVKNEAAPEESVDNVGGCPARRRSFETASRLRDWPGLVGPDILLSDGE